MFLSFYGTPEYQKPILFMLLNSLIFIRFRQTAIFLEKKKLHSIILARTSLTEIFNYFCRKRRSIFNIGFLFICFNIAIFKGIRLATVDTRARAQLAHSLDLGLWTKSTWPRTTGDKVSKDWTLDRQLLLKI